MGYRVVYGQEHIAPAREGIRVGRTVIMSAFAGMLFLGAVRRFWPEGAAVLDTLAGCGGFAEVRGALERLALEIQAGTGLREAVAAFCRDVVSMGLAYAA